MNRVILIIIIVIIGTTNVSAKNSSIVIDEKTGRILYQNNAYEKKLIASTTKIMTAILAIENLDLNKKIEIGKEVLDSYGTNIYIEVGEKISVIDLLYGLMLRSGNDAAMSLAVAVSGTEKEFVMLMNEKARQIGMNNTTFENAHGLDEKTQNYSTAYDMALLMKYANNNKIFIEISNTNKYKTSSSKKTYLWYNRNKLLNEYKYCTGGKNGYTPSAGKTLVSTAKKDNHKLIAVSLNDSNIYENHKKLYENIYTKYHLYKIVDKTDFKIDTDLFQNKVQIKEDFEYPLTVEEKNNIKIKIVKLKNITQNEIIGYIEIRLKENIIGKIDIYENKKKENKSLSLKIKNYFEETLKKLKLGLQKSLKPGPLVPNPPEIYKLVLLTL